jgi:predicted glutamine amidotransferase
MSHQNIIRSLITGWLAALLVLFFIQPGAYTSPDAPHNCRIWGTIFSELPDSIVPLLATHLTRFKQLGTSNPDGWGLAYFLSRGDSVLIPVLSKGEPGSHTDPRYERQSAQMLAYMESSALAHVRSSSSGTSGIPDPHPFFRQAIVRDFSMLFAHNGTLPVEVLLSLILDLDPIYLYNNPPDYAPVYLDSDLLAIYIMETIDTYLDSTIEQCIKMATTAIDSALGTTPAEYNFVMSDGETLWAVRCASGYTNAPTLHYFPLTSPSPFYIVASQPLDTLIDLWVAMPESTLTVLAPNQSPHSVRLLDRVLAPEISGGFDLIFPNPFTREIIIRFHLPGPGDPASTPVLKIANSAGQIVEEFPVAQSDSRSHTITWDGTDAQDRLLPNGVYFCHLRSGNNTYAQKIIMLR